MRLLLLALGLLGTGSAKAYCFNEAGGYYGIAPVVLQSIAEHESGMNPDLALRNTNGSIDVGLMGINSINFDELKQVGINPDRLKEPCVNVIAGHTCSPKRFESMDIRGMPSERITLKHQNASPNIAG